MTFEFKEKVREELQCSLCYNMIMDPRVLQCPHTFCLGCLEKSYTSRLRRRRASEACDGSPIREDEFECPLCRHITHLPEPDPVQPTRARIASLSTNVPLKNVARLLHVEADESAERHPHSICELHSNQQRNITLDNYCEACGELVCYMCVHCPPHSSHKQSVHLAVDLLQDRAEALRALAVDIATKASSVKHEQQEMQERLVKNRAEIIRAIELSHEKKLALLRKRVGGLLTAVEENTKGKLTALEQSLQRLEEAKKFASQTEKSVEQKVTDTDLSVLANEQSLLQELRTHQQAVQEASMLSGNEVNLDLVLRFEEDRSLDHYLSAFGRLKECQYKCDATHRHPLLRVKHELKISNDGETYIASSTHANLPSQLEYGMFPPPFMMQHFGVPYTPNMTGSMNDFGPGYVFASSYPAAMGHLMPAQATYPAYGEQPFINTPFRDGRQAKGSFMNNQMQMGPPTQDSAMPELRMHALSPEEPKYKNKANQQSKASPGSISPPIRTRDVHLHVGELPDNLEESDGEYCYTSTETTRLVSSLTSSRLGALEGSLISSTGSCESAPVNGLHDFVPEEPRNPTGVSMISETSYPSTPLPPSSSSECSSHNSTPNSSPKCKRRASLSPPEQVIPARNPSTGSFQEVVYEDPIQCFPEPPMCATQHSLPPPPVPDLSKAPASHSPNESTDDFELYEELPQESEYLYEDFRACNPTGVSEIIEDTPSPNISDALQTPQCKESHTSSPRLLSVASSPAAFHRLSPFSGVQAPTKPNHPTDGDPEEIYELPREAGLGDQEPKDENVYEDIDNPMEVPPAACTVRRPKYDSLPPIPTDKLLSHRKAGQARWMLASHPPFVPSTQLNQPKTSLLKPIQIIENDQFMPESTTDVCPSGVCCTGSFNNIVITDVSNHCLRVVDRNGSFVAKIGRRGGGNGCFNMPVALVISSDNFYYVVDQQNARVQKFAAYGSADLIFGEKKGRQLLKKPQGIAIHRVTGDVYVADSDKKRIYVYQNDGTYVRPIGKHEKAISFNCPVAVAINKSDQLLVVDRSSQANGRHCIWCIRQPEPELIRKIGEGVLKNPSGIAVTEDGTILVTELDSGSVCVFSQGGDPIVRFGQTGTGQGMFNQPCGICINSKGQVVVADKGNHRVQIFSLKDIMSED